MKTLAVILALASFSLYADESGWTQLKQSFESYYTVPSDQNAELALASLASVAKLPKDGKTFPEKKEAIEFIAYYEQRFEILEYQVASGHGPSIKLALTLLTISDGALSEDLLGVLGQSIRTNPTAFLEALKARGVILARAVSNLPLSKAISLGSMFKELFHDQIDNQSKCLENSRRVHAVLSVNKSELQSIKNSTLSALRSLMLEDECPKIP